MKRLFLVLLLFALAFSLGCEGGAGVSQRLPALPPASPDTADGFGIDQNINMHTIDGYLHREDTVYRDMRMLFDPADFGSVGGEADLTRTIEGFKIVPFPYVATLQSLPVDSAYVGDCLYTVVWNSDGSIASAEPNYRESEMALRELFPRDKAIFLMCGGGGYAGMMRELLLHLGWEASAVYNIGANWTYHGDHALELTVYPEEASEKPLYAVWRADYAYFAFEKMERLSK